MDSKEYWNLVAGEKKFTTPFQMDIYKNFVTPDQKILDVGCGYGRTLKELYDNGYFHLLGVDFSSEMVQKAKSLYPYIPFAITNGKTLEFEDNSFDSVILLGVLTCIYDSESQMNLINEVYRVLREDGIIYVNDFLLNDTDMYLERYKRYQDKYGDYGIFETTDGGVFRHNSIHQFVSLLNQFECKDTKTLKYKTMNGHISNGIYYVGKK